MINIRKTQCVYFDTFENSPNNYTLSLNIVTKQSNQQMVWYLKWKDHVNFLVKKQNGNFKAKYLAFC